MNLAEAESLKIGDVVRWIPSGAIAHVTYPTIGLSVACLQFEGDPFPKFPDVHFMKQYERVASTSFSRSPTMAQVAVEDEEQLQLIDVDHPQAKALRRAASAYKKAQRERMQAGAKEIHEKAKLIAVAKEIGVKPDADGKIGFRMSEVVIRITPRDELVRVKFEEEVDEVEEAEEGEEDKTEGDEPKRRAKRSKAGS